MFQTLIFKESLLIIKKLVKITLLHVIVRSLGIISIWLESTMLELFVGGLFLCKGFVFLFELVKDLLSPKVTLWIYLLVLPNMIHILIR